MGSYTTTTVSSSITHQPFHVWVANSVCEQCIQRPYEWGLIWQGFSMPFVKLWPAELHPSRKILIKLGLDSHTDADSSEYAKKLHINALPSIGDGTTLPLGNLALISRFGQRDDKVRFNRELCTRTNQRRWPIWIWWQRCRRVCQRRWNCQIWHQTCTKISWRKNSWVASASEPTETTGNAGGTSLHTIQPLLIMHV